MKKIRAGGGVVFREGEKEPLVLLIKRNRLWDLPKGKIELGETDPECAVREVEEETGAVGVEIADYLCTTWHEYSEKEELIGKTTAWYLMKESSVDREGYAPQQEEGITELKWVPVSESIDLVGYHNLKQVLREAEKRFQ